LPSICSVTLTKVLGGVPKQTIVNPIKPSTHTSFKAIPEGTIKQVFFRQLIKMTRPGIKENKQA